MTTEYLDLSDFVHIAAAVTGLDVDTVMKVADLNLADSALHAPAAGFGDTDFYSDFVDKAAVLIVRLARNHPLPDGNKRTAWVALRLFVEMKGGSGSRRRAWTTRRRRCSPSPRASGTSTSRPTGYATTSRPVERERRRCDRRPGPRGSVREYSWRACAHSVEDMDEGPMSLRGSSRPTDKTRDHRGGAMRIVISDFMSLDGVIQAPGGPQEDTDGGFENGGWSMPFFDPETMGPAIGEVMQTTEALLFGRRTWQTMAAAWPGRAGDPFADRMNEIPKYVVSRTLTQADLDWNNSTLLSADDVVDAVRGLRAESGESSAWTSATS